MIARANKKDQPPPTTVIAKPEGLWQSVTPAARCAARPRRGRKDADCHTSVRTGSQ